MLATDGRPNASFSSLPLERVDRRLYLPKHFCLLCEGHAYLLGVGTRRLS